MQAKVEERVTRATPHISRLTGDPLCPDGPFNEAVARMSRYIGSRFPCPFSTLNQPAQHELLLSSYTHIHITYDLIMQKTVTMLPSQSPSYLSESLETILQQEIWAEGDTFRREVTDCLTCLRPANDDEEKKKKNYSYEKLLTSVCKEAGISGTRRQRTRVDGHVRQIAANLWCRAASQSEQKILREHGVDPQTAYRLSGIRKDEGTLTDSTFAVKVSDDQYRLLQFGTQGQFDEWRIGDAGFRTRLGETESVAEMEERRKCGGTHCAELDSLTHWIRTQEGPFFTSKRKGDRSLREIATDTRATLKYEPNSIGPSGAYKAKKRLWTSKYNHTKREGDEEPFRRKGTLEMLCSNLVAETLLLLNPSHSTVIKLSELYDLSEAMVVNCGKDSTPDLDQSCWLIPADTEAQSTHAETSQNEASRAVDPFDRFYHCLKFDKGKLASRVEVTVGEAIGMLQVADQRGGKAVSSKKRAETNEADGAGSSVGTKKPRLVS
jgi:hypothetical protein